MKRFQNDLGWYFNGVEIRRKYPSKKSLRNRIIKAILTWLIITIITFFGIIAKEGCSPEVALTIIIPLFLIIVIIGILSKFWLLKIITIKRRNSSMIINGMNIPCYLFNA